MSQFKMTDNYGDYYSERRFFEKGDKNGILIKKSVELYKEQENVFYTAEMFFNGKFISIGFGDTVEEIQDSIHLFLESTKHIVQTETLPKE